MFPVRTTTAADTELVDCLLSLGLSQINTVRNRQGRLLDLIFSNNIDDKFVIASMDILTSIDLYHPALDVMCNGNCDSNLNYFASYKFDFKNANNDNLSALLASYDCTTLMGIVVS